MDIGKIKEDLSICYLKAVAAAKGIALEEQRHDEDSIDVELKKVLQLDDALKYEAQLAVQLKSTSSISQYKVEEDRIVYRLKVKNYNDLCIARTVPIILMLFILPGCQEEWIEWTEAELLLRGKMYWCSLFGKEKSENTGTVSIAIPKENIIDTDTIEKLLVTVAEEGRL